MANISCQINVSLSLFLSIVLVFTPGTNLCFQSVRFYYVWRLVLFYFIIIITFIVYAGLNIHNVHACVTLHVFFLDDSTFPVGIEDTEASKRCNLGDADYRLCVNACDISLKNQHVVLYSWPYK